MFDQKFPYIEHIHDILPHIQGKPELRFIPQIIGNSRDRWMTICYMISSNDTFTNDYARECRGITFDHNGYIASRPFHKFFNIGERQSTQKENLDLNNIHTIMDKLDGSMITTCVYNNHVYCRTKKTFDSDVAKLAQKYLNTNERLRWFCLSMNKQGMSPIFEYTSPKARIVINYAQEQMSLLAIRNLKTGEYQSRAALETSADVYGIPCVEVSKLSALEVLETIDNIPNKEGFVFQFNNGEMVKLKTSSYLTLHHTVVFQRERDIAEMVLDEKLDDYKGYLKDSKSDESLVKVHAIEKRVIEELNTIMTGLDSLFSQAVVGDITRKDIAAKYNKHKYFSLLMKKLDGHDMDSHVKEYFKKNLLKEMFSLEQI